MGSVGSCGAEPEEAAALMSDESKKRSFSVITSDKEVKPGDHDSKSPEELPSDLFERLDVSAQKKIEEIGHGVDPSKRPLYRPCCSGLIH